MGTPIPDQDKNAGIISDPITNTDQGWIETVPVNPDAGKGTVVTWSADDKIKDQMGDRGWTDKNIDSAIAAGATGTSIDKRKPSKTDEKWIDDSRIEWNKK